ncbi:13624_t:CDS:2 [Gigaspora rosea]|nr:13624_t:CDS:2 [Gigaspora rosea]
MSCTCDPCISSCPIAYPPGGCGIPIYGMSSPRCDHSAIIGTSITLGVVSGIILPICIALIFYYQRYAKQAYQYQNSAAMTTQSEQISMQNFANGAHRNTLNNQQNPN